MKGAVFLGPSLPLEEARALLEGMKVDYHPPVRRGDLPALAQDVSVVAIIDGVFLGESSVGHREIAALLARGVVVLGGSSMGALRAYELHDLGMRGYGIVYQMYSSGAVDGDDEVALVFDPDSLEPVSEPLVNTRYLLREAVVRGILTEAEAASLIAAVKKEFYPRRNKPLLLRIAAESLGNEKAESIAKLAEDTNFDAKRCDAMLILNTMRMLLGIQP
ncbi:MAG: TfuA-like protein [Methanomassiliicoccales archaeon]